MLLVQVSKSPIINSNLLVTYKLSPALLRFSLKDVEWRVRSGAGGKRQVVGRPGRPKGVGGYNKSKGRECKTVERKKNSLRGCKVDTHKKKRRRRRRK